MEIPSSNMVDKSEIWREAGLETKHLASLVLRGQLNQGNYWDSSGAPRSKRSSLLRKGQLGTGLKRVE